MSVPNPPSFASHLFKWFCKSEHFEELQGDLEEAFEEHVELYGLKKAKAIYQKEIFKMIRPSVMKHLNVLPSNFSRLPKNYLKTSIRAIKLNPFYITANIVGLALALSICTIGYFNYHFNASFNQSFEQASKLYKVHGLRTGESTVGVSSVALAPMLNSSGIPAMRYTRKNIPIRLEKKLFQENVAFVDRLFFQYFAPIGLNGKTIEPMEKDEIAISAATALKLFDEPYPIDKTLTFVFPNKKEKSYVITQVFQKPATNTSFVYSIIMDMENYLDAYDVNESDWSSWINGTFVFLENNEKTRVEGVLEEVLEVQNSNNTQLSISSFQLDDILQWPAMENSLHGRRFKGHLHPSSVYGIAGSALAILLLACFNFINTSIALSGKRLKEIAVRKVLGGNRKSTITQFMIENTFMISLAVILSFGISYLLIPSYNALFQQELIQLDKVPALTILKFSGVLILVVTALSAAYPALYVSKFPALVIFKNKIVLSSKNRIMVGLLTFQFALCFYNMFGLYLLVDNAYYQETLDRGYDLGQVINIPLNRPEQFEVLRDELAQSPNVASISGTQSVIGFSGDQKFLEHEGSNYSVAMISIGVNYAESLGLRLNKGSFFSRTDLETEGNEVIINKMLEDRLGIDLLNQLITVQDNKYKVIGVVDDFNLRNIMMDNKIMPAVIKLAASNSYNYASVRVNGSVEDANTELEQAWYSVFPQELYTGFLQKRVLDNVKETNYIMIRINLFVGIISILISVLGLYTLISLTVQRRSKEFGVRKVLGASRNVIAHLLGKDLYWMLAISCIVGLAASTYILKVVFDIIYAYHITPDLSHFVRATGTVLFIIILAVGYKVYQTGKMNPVEQLRNE